MKSLVTMSMLFISVFISTLLISCGGSSTATSTTGSAMAQLVWQQAATSKAVKSTAPGGVATVRVTISGSGITPDIQQDYAAGAGAGSISNIPAGSNRTFTFQGLNAGGSITYQAVVNNVTITAGATTDLGSITMLVVVPPAAPTGLGASATDSSTITVSWTDSDQLETGFVLERKTGAGGVWTEIATPVANSVSYSDSGLTGGTTYYYRIKATNGAGDSGWSNEANTTTTALTYTVTPSAGAHGSISPATAQTVNHGATTSFTVTPDSGYAINAVSGCGGSLSGSTYTTGAISANCSVTASFVSTTGTATFTW